MTEPANPETRFVAAASTDGIYHQVDVGGAASLGAWESTGPSSTMGTPVGTLDELFAEFDEGTEVAAPPTTSY